jgi:SNF2 family DNA or RNA helicase
MAMKSLFERPTLVAPSSTPRRPGELYQHQQHGLDLGKQGNRAFFWECGTGKTLLALHLIRYHKQRESTPALVVCPLSIIQPAWIADCRRFTPELTIRSLWAKTPAQRRQALTEDADIYVTNFVGLKLLYSDLLKKHFRVLIVDESSKMKNPKSQITKSLLSLAGVHFRGSRFRCSAPIPQRYCLSGTPAPNDESEYWGQIKFITGPGGKCLNDNFYAFRGKYFYAIPIGHTGQNIWKFRSSMRSEFERAIAPVTHVVRKRDCLDLPEKIQEVRQVQLSTPERAAYNQFKNDLVLRFEDVQVLGTTALTEVMKLRQLSSGFAYGEDHSIARTGESKLKELKAVLEEIGPHQAIIWVQFRAEIEQLEKALPDAVTLWSGTVDHQVSIEGFQSGRARYLIANPAAAGHGLTFTNCHYAVYFSLSYSYELFKQSQERIHRIGQRQSCTYIYLLAADTIDEVLLTALRRKRHVSDLTLSYLKGNRRETSKRLAV